MHIPFNERNQDMTLRDEAGLNLTPKQLKFVEAYVETRGNAPEAALQAYNCSNRNSARVIAHRNLNNPKVVAYLKRVLLQHGAVDKVAKTLLDSLDANTIYRGETTDLPDHQTRPKGAVEIAKMMGVYD